MAKYFQPTIYWWMWLLIHAIDTCIWHLPPEMKKKDLGQAIIGLDHQPLPEYNLENHQNKILENTRKCLWIYNFRVYCQQGQKRDDSLQEQLIYGLPSNYHSY